VGVGAALLTLRLFVPERADRPGADLAPYACLLEGLARGRFRRREPLDRPTLGHDPSPRLSRRHDKNFERGQGREPIGQSAILDADRRPRPSFFGLLGNDRISKGAALSGVAIRDRREWAKIKPLRAETPGDGNRGLMTAAFR